MPSYIDTPNETRLGELVTVGHSAIVHACTVDDEAADRAWGQ